MIAHASSRDDVVFGTVLLGRLQGSTDTQRMLGMFINTLPLRLRIGDLTVRELIDHTQRGLVDVLKHEQASLAVAQSCSAVGASLPLFSALLNYRHITLAIETGQPSLGSGIQVLSSQEWTNYPMVLSVDDQRDGFVLTAHTDRRIEPKRLISYVTTTICSLVEAAESAPETPALALRVLPETERNEVVHSFNATRAPFPSGKLINEVFEEQARRSPDSVAVLYEGQQLTYAELNRRANQLARHLQGYGLKPDDRVAICVERSVEMIVGILGILKAGAAYVPLDPDLSRLPARCHAGGVAAESVTDTAAAEGPVPERADTSRCARRRLDRDRP